MEFTLGADPEVFYHDYRTGALVPMCGLLGGTKEKPAPIPSLCRNPGFTMQEDNVMAEFNIPPATTTGDFLRYISAAMVGLDSFVQKKNPYLKRDHNCSRLFLFSQLQHPKAQEFGCSPDMDSYEEGRVYPKITREQLREDVGEWRFAGGHLHLGYSGNIPHFAVANLADLFLGLPSLISLKADNQGKRRALYGQPGRYRPKSYGIEYRTLSNYWLFNEDEIIKVADRAFSLMNHMNDLSALQSLYQNIPWADVRRAIQEENKNLASDVLVYTSDALKMEIPYL